MVGTGEAAKEQDPGAPTYACLVRLAVKLKDQKALNAFLDPFVTHALVCQPKPQKITTPHGERGFVSSPFDLRVQQSVNYPCASNGIGRGL